MIQYYFQKKFSQEIIGFIDKIIINLKSGFSFREAFNKSLISYEGYVFDRISFIKDCVFYVKNQTEYNNEFENNLIEYFKNLDNSSNQNLEKLMFLRNKLSISRNFIKKTRSIRNRIWGQIGFIVLLYLITIIFFRHFIELRSNSMIFTISLFLFLLGTMLLFKIERSFKWKI